MTKPDAPAPTAPPPSHPLPETYDPEVAALLGFVPVQRKCKRHDGWTEAIQRGFIIALAALGSPWRAAQAVGRTESGAYKLRTSASGEAFAEAWDKALALYLRRNPPDRQVGRPSRGSKRDYEELPEEQPDPEAEHELKKQLLNRILEKYWIKLKEERQARIEGRIVAADFYARQLTWIEIIADLGHRAGEILAGFERNEIPVRSIAATPMSVLLDDTRRDFWRALGEPERPPLFPLGEHDGEVAIGVPTAYNSARDGRDFRAHARRQDEAAALAAKAQAAWEEKARADAAAWKERETQG